ncbi:MAG: glycosyltransferase [Candidatus Hermodarchaeota archaeon]
MNILVLQETDWLIRGPHTQHHIFERLSKNPRINVTVLDYDIDKIMRSNSLFLKKKVYTKIIRTIKNANVTIIRTAHIQIPYLRRLSSLVTNFFEILNVIRRNRVDIIISLSLSNGLIGILLAKIFNIPYIYYYIDKLHTLVPMGYLRGIARVITKFLLRYCNRIIAVTKLLEKYVINQGANPQKVSLILNGIALENTIIKNQKLEELRVKYSISDDDFIVFFMGYLYDFAGLKQIINYYHKRISNGFMKMKFLILGDGGIYNELVKLVSDIDAKWVILTGKLPFFEIAEYIALADLCLLSFALNEITRDITPIKVIEYLAMKKPVLSTSLPGVLYEIGRNNGILFAKNQEDLIKKIAEFSVKKKYLQKLGQKGYEFVKDKYAWPNILEDFKMVMIKLMHEKYKKL